MALSERDLEQVGNYVRAHLIEWLPGPVLELISTLMSLSAFLG